MPPKRSAKKASPKSSKTRRKKATPAVTKWPNQIQLARWRKDLQGVYDSVLNSREQVYAWYEEAGLIAADAETKTDELLECVADIKKDWQRYREIIKQVPNVAEFSDEEVEKRSGKADELLNLAWEVSLIKRYFPRKIDKLRFLLEHRTQ